MRFQTRTLVAMAALAASLNACRGSSARPAEHEAVEHEQAAEVSDLDQPAEVLFAAMCEHGRKTHECSECRYEVGIVRAPRDLFACGLMKKTSAGKRAVESTVALTGEVQFDERRVVHVSSQAEGIIRKVHVTLGDPVRRGQPLVELESVGVGEAQGAYLEAEAVLALARRTHDRQLRLRKELISSEKEYLQAKQDLDAAEIRAAGARGKLTRLGMDGGSVRMLSQQEAKGRLVLRAPSDGVVLAMHAVPGEVAKTEESLLTLGDNSAVWVWANVYEHDMAVLWNAQAGGKLKAGVSVKAYPAEEFPARVDFVSPAMDASSRTARIRLEIDNAQGRLLAGMYATVEVYLPGQEQALLVPAGAVLEDEGRAFVFLHHHGDYYIRRPVTVGRTFDRWVEVKEGLAGGETVVADGSFLMKSDVLRSKMGAGCAD